MDLRSMCLKAIPVIKGPGQGIIPTYGTPWPLLGPGIRLPR